MIPVQELLLNAPGKGGANEKIAGHLIDDSQSARPDSSTLPLKNCHTNTIGSIVKRKGYSVHSNGQITISGSPNVTLSAICGLYDYKNLAGTNFTIVAGSNGSAQKIVDLSTPASPVDITGSVTFTDDTMFDFATVAGTLVMTTSDRDSPMKWTGTGNCAALGGSPPAGKFCEEFFNYLFIANTSSNPERIYWSGLFDPESHTATDFKRLEDSVTGIAKRDSVLFAFTNNSIWVVQYTGDSVNPFTFDRLDTSVGCIAQRTIQNIEGVLYWLGGDGHIYRMQGFTPERVTEAIPVTIGELNAGANSIACAVDQRELRQYWCCVPRDSSAFNDFIIAIDYLNNEIFFYDGFEVNSIADFVDSNGNLKTRFGDRTGRVYLTNNGTSDYLQGTSSTIDYWKYSKVFDLGGGMKNAHIRRMRASVNSVGNFSSQVDIIGDFGNTGGSSLELSHDSGRDLLGSTWVMGESLLGRVLDILNTHDLNFNARYIQLKFLKLSCCNA